MNDDDKTRLLQELMDYLTSRGKGYSLEGPKMLTVRMKDGTYRNKEAFGTEFLPTDVRIGSKEPIFCFEPEDAQEFVAVEVKTSKMDDTFPLLLDDAKKWMERRFAVRPDDTNVVTLSEINDCTSFRQAVETTFQLEEKDLVKMAAQDDTEMVSLPTFGMF